MASALPSSITASGCIPTTLLGHGGVLNLTTYDVLVSGTGCIPQDSKKRGKNSKISSTPLQHHDHEDTSSNCLFQCFGLCSKKQRRRVVVLKNATICFYKEKNKDRRQRIKNVSSNIASNPSNLSNTSKACKAKLNVYDQGNFVRSNSLIPREDDIANASASNETSRMIMIHKLNLCGTKVTANVHDLEIFIEREPVQDYTNTNNNNNASSSAVSRVQSSTAQSRTRSKSYKAGAVQRMPSFDSDLDDGQLNVNVKSTSMNSSSVTSNPIATTAPSMAHTRSMSQPPLLSSTFYIKLKFEDKAVCEQWFDALLVASTYKFADHYELGPLLGTGAFADVRLCRDRLSDSKFAVKIIKTPDSELSPVLKREIQIHLRTHHDNIVEVRDIFIEPKQTYIVMEYIEGGTLRELAPLQLSEAMCKVFMKQVLRAVQYMHRIKVIHRDIKLANVLINSKEHQLQRDVAANRKNIVKITDFGLSNCPRANCHAVFQSCVGSPRFISPEVVLGQSYSFPADMWSVGVIAFCLLSGGDYPVVGQSKNEILRRLVQGKLESMDGERWDSISNEGKQFVSRLLELNPNDRLTADEALCHPWLDS
eukprot:CAMPEP_0184706338 /NCGR_PEP_ID=MMETSP0313-20130426/36705_1 /TAXON_ID=2792 /ORGANISM="Porphyridium aerugineum, Strain SAG 1380-2" /LENGTH=592 /DNA_ID=CAMNT_0027167889 /DNA_START=638 /DNA_END=2416 /DNA_ORIENTATION=-